MPFESARARDLPVRHLPVRRWLASAIGVTGLLLLAGGCGEPARVEVSAPTATDGSLGSGITVSGTGKVNGKPDTLTVSIGVTTKRPSVDSAVSDNASTTTAVTDAVKAGGVAGKDIQTANYSVQPSFNSSNGRQVADGYTVNNTVTVKLRDLGAAGRVIDSATQAGGNDAAVQGVSFTLEDNQALLTQARDEAFADAKAKAAQLGQLSGRGLGDAQAISEEVAPTSTQFRSVGAAVDSAAATPIEPGQVSTNVTLNVRFALG
jgi:uncharacterized protein YggE